MMRFEESVVGMRERAALAGELGDRVQAVVLAYESGLLQPGDLQASEVR